MESNSPTAKNKNSFIKWGIRVMLGIIILGLGVAGAIQIPWVQRKAVIIATEIATEALNTQVSISSVELHPFRRSIRINGIKCIADDLEFECGSIDLKGFINSVLDDSSIIEFGTIELHDIHLNTDNLDSLIAQLQSGSTPESSASLRISQLIINNLDWQVSDSLRGHISYLDLHSVSIKPQTIDSKMEFQVDNFNLLGNIISIDSHSPLIMNEAKGTVSWADESLRLNLDTLNAEGIQVKGIGTWSQSLTSGNASIFLKPDLFTEWISDEFLAAITEYNIPLGTLEGDISYNNGVLSVDEMIWSEGLKFNGEYTDDVNPSWQVDAEVNLQEAEVWMEKTIDISAFSNLSKVINLKANGDLSHANGSLSIDPITDIDFNIEMKSAGGWNADINIESLQTSYGPLNNITASVIGSKDRIEFRWDNDINGGTLPYLSNLSSNNWILYGKLNGYAELVFLDKEKTNIDRKNNWDLNGRLNLRHPVLLNGLGGAPINFERFDVTVNLLGDYLEVGIESDLMTSNSVISLDDKKWTSWIEKMASREKKDEVHDQILTKGNCIFHKPRPIAALLDLDISISKGTEVVWHIAENTIKGQASSNWVEIDDMLFNDIFLDIDGTTNENWINVSVSELIKDGGVIASELYTDLHADTVWTADSRWKNKEGIEGLVRLEGGSSNEGSSSSIDTWEFQLYQATIPLGEDTLELLKAPASLKWGNSEFSSDGMSWTGGGFVADIKGEIGEQSGVPLSFYIHTDEIDSSRTRTWFNVPIQADAIQLNGTLSGTIQKPQLSITGRGEGITYGGETIPLSVFSFSYSKGKIGVDAEMTGLGENVKGKISFSGDVDIINGNDLNIYASLDDVPLAWANTLIDKKTAVLGGELDASFFINGTPKRPIIEGGGTLKNATAAINYLGTSYGISGDFHIAPDGVELNGLKVSDGKEGEAFLVGTVLHDNFKKWNLDLSLSMEETPLEVMNIPRSPDAYFYGHGYALGDVNIFGYADQIIIEAQITTSKGTEFVMPMDAATSNNWSSFVHIIDPNISKESSEELDVKSSVQLKLLINVTPESEARIVFDEAVGDEIIGRCSGTIHIALDDFERLAMFGSLKVVEGEYLFTLHNFMNKRFIAKPGGTIKWFGDPYEAEINLKTSYNTRASLKPIVPDIVNASKQRVELILNMNGDLLRPGINFDINLPDADSRTKASLASLLTNEEERNRQAISLLVLQQFMPASWQAAAIGSTGLQENSTELISAQLGNWLSGINEEVDVGIDYDAGNNSGDEASLAVALSTQLLNDRLHIEGEVGTQRLNTGSIEDLQLQDVRLSYDLNDDGSVQLTGYTTQRQTIPGLEGESIQGVGVLLHRDFDSLKDLFNKRK